MTTDDLPPLPDGYYAGQYDAEDMRAYARAAIAAHEADKLLAETDTTPSEAKRVSRWANQAKAQPISADVEALCEALMSMAFIPEMSDADIEHCTRAIAMLRSLDARLNAIARPAVPAPPESPPPSRQTP